MILSLCFASLCWGANSDPIIIYGDYDGAVALSKESNKPLLLIFGADWCGYCTKLKKDILVDNSTQLYITCVIDTDLDKSLSKKFKVRSLPTSIIVEDEVEKRRKTGYKNKQDYLDWLSQ